MLIRSLFATASFVSVVLLAVASTVSPTLAKSEKAIQWKNLLPVAKPLVDPFNRLTQDQRFDIETIIWARTLSDAERELDYNRQPLEDAKKYEKQFKEAGIDVTKLMQEYAVFQAEVAKRQKQVNSSLNGANIKMSGYLLPLEFSEKGEKDFLLVPYVGACVHVPPPPPNQIVLVRLAEKMVVKDLFTPVWIRGRLKTKQSSKALSFVDGSRDVSIGYHIDDALTEPYREPQ